MIFANYPKFTWNRWDLCTDVNYTGNYPDMYVVTLDKIRRYTKECWPKTYKTIVTCLWMMIFTMLASFSNPDGLVADVNTPNVAVEESVEVEHVLSYELVAPGPTLTLTELSVPEIIIVEVPAAQPAFEQPTGQEVANATPGYSNPPVDVTVSYTRVDPVWGRI